MNLWCIHGNLQLPSVWNCFDGNVYEAAGEKGRLLMTLHKENLWTLKDYTFQGWTHSFLQKVTKPGIDMKPWIMGYSLGGRLAMHAVLAQPEKWRGAIIIAAHPGSSNTDEQVEQLARDKKWSKRFRNEPWELVINEWDRLPVFGGFEPVHERNPRDYPPEIISDMFLGFSKAKQNDLWDALLDLSYPPILYISGELDSKYREIGEQLDSLSENIMHVSIPHACHRVPWENNEDFINTIQYFIDSVHNIKQ